MFGQLILVLAFILPAVSWGQSVCRALSHIDALPASEKARALRLLGEIEDLRTQGYHGPKPRLQNTAKHDPTRKGFDGHRSGPLSSELPANSEALYQRAIPDPADGGRTWWARDDMGNYHRFQKHGDDIVHWNGSSTSTQGGGIAIREHDIPIAVRRRLQKQAELDRLIN